MKENNNILQRARDFDLTESELKELYSNPEKLKQLYDDSVIDNISEELFVPGKSELFKQKQAEIRRLTKLKQPTKKRLFTLPIRLMGIAATIILLASVIFLLRPQSGNITDQQIAEFNEISRSAYSPQVIASLERSTDSESNQSLVAAYINEDYDYILTETTEELESAELMLLRARVLMNLERYEEGYEIMQTINQTELVQQDVYLWMMAEGALGVGNINIFKIQLENIKKMNLPQNGKLKNIKQ